MDCKVPDEEEKKNPTKVSDGFGWPQRFFDPCTPSQTRCVDTGHDARILRSSFLEILPSCEDSVFLLKVLLILLRSEIPSGIGAKLRSKQQ